MTKVFHVDDEKLVLDRVREILAPHFESVGSADRGDGVLESVAELRPHVVLLDISLPDRNGFDVARSLRKSFPEVKIVFLTVHSHEAYVEEAFRMGASGYVLKSAIASELVSALFVVAGGGTFASAGLPSVTRPPVSS